ncbi:YafY family protein [uncultured Megasphaera sp.]|uniref:helix-turn-helix transcriptional regulator n=1 Tax=uncultured Megasphaera sp. TaxID=165188 RepID=UPI00265B66A9|nr:WYL domain-containing protein [uncultured Megasphaera sp.]
MAEKEHGTYNKISRTLSLYTKLLNGNCLHAEEEAQEQGVTVRSIQRDIQDIQEFFSNSFQQNDTMIPKEVIYNRRKKGYELRDLNHPTLTDSEILAICKILLDSRAFTKQEMTSMLDRLISGCVVKTKQKEIKELINNEAFHYVEPRHKTVFIDTMWTIGEAIRSSHYLEIHYTRLKEQKTVCRKIKPAAIMFSEYYFYVAAFIEDAELKDVLYTLNDANPTIYRLDRIKQVVVLPETFRTPYSERFQEGEFRKRIQFMYSGKLRKVRFTYNGADINAVLDRLPTAVIESEKDGVYTVSAEVYGNGIDMWLRSQGNTVQVL